MAKLEGSPDSLPSLDLINITKSTVYTLLESAPNRVTFTLNEGPQAKSAVWEKFKIIHIDGKPISYVKCNSCIAVLQWNSKTGTSTMVKHKCNIPDIKNTSVPPNQQLLTNMIPKSVPSSAINSLNDTVVMGLAMDIRPLSAVEGSGFLKLGQALINFGAKYGPQKIENVIKSRKTLRENHLSKIAGKMREELKDSLRLSPCHPCYTFTFDLWTETKRNRPFISLTCHFVDKSFFLQNKLLGVEELPADEKKTTENIRNFCKNILRIYFPRTEDMDEVAAVMNASFAVTDGGSNVVKVFEKRLPCMNHKLNLVLENSFSHIQNGDIQNTITTAKSLVKYFKKSGLNARLKKSLKQEVPTRWNSLLTMLESVSTSYSEIQQLLLEVKQLDRIIGFKATLVQELVYLLTPFKLATELFSKERTSTIDKVVPQYYLLEKHLKVNDEDSPAIVILKTTMTTWLHHYYADSLEIIHFAATALNPKYKSLRMIENERRMSAYSLLKEMVAAVPDKDIKVEADLEDLIHVSPSPKKKLKPDFSFREFEDSSDEDETAPTNEVDTYLNSRLAKDNREETSDPIAFWQKSSQYPKLRIVAVRLLSIPASQTSDERTFSITGQTINDRRSLLSGKSVSDLTIIQKNSQ